MKHFKRLQTLSPETATNFLENLNARGKDAQEYIRKDFSDFNDFVDKAFTWSDTPQGSAFWQDVANGVMPQERLTFTAHFESMSEEISRLFVSNNPYKNRSFLGETRLTLGEYINGAFTYSDTAQGLAFWRHISQGEKRETNKLVRDVLDLSFVYKTLHDGTRAPSYLAVELTDIYYPAGTYALATEAHKIGMRYYLTANLVEAAIAVGSDNHKRLAPLEEHFIKFEGVYYECANALNNAGIFYIQDIGEYRRQESGLYVQYINKFGHKEYYTWGGLPEDAVVLRRLRSGERYASANYADVYKCAINGLYYLQTENSYIYFSNYIRPDGTRESIYVNRNNTHHVEGLHGERFNVINLEDEEGQTASYATQGHYERAFLSVHTCPHCAQEVSQHHDKEACKRRNFKNERFDYHSQKPRDTYSQSIYRIGVEIEKECMDGASHSHRAIYNKFGWVKERDGSLNGDCGYELVSPIYALNSPKLMRDAREIESQFPKIINGDFSESCGGHIHFSKRATGGQNLLEEVCGYLPLLYAIYKGRTKRNYSQAKTKDNIKHSEEKYQAVRILRDRIEFRIFPAVKNLTTLEWRIKLLRIIASNPTASPIKVVNDLCDKRTQLHALFLEIFTEQTIYKRAIDALIMAKKYDNDCFNIDFSKQTKQIERKAKANAKK